MVYHRVCKYINTTGVTSGAGTVHPSRAPEFTSDFKWCSYYSIFSFMCNVLQIAVFPFVLFLLAIVLFVLLSFGHCVICPSVFWPLCYLSFCLLAIVLSVLLSFGHCVICPSVFWPLCYLSFCLLAIVLSVCLRFMESDYLFGIFKLFSTI